MAKAQITTPQGTKVIIEGTPEEVAFLVSKFEGDKKHAKAEESASKPKRGNKAGPVSLITDLIDGDFFKKPKELSAIKLALEEQGHYYPVTTLSPIMLKLVRRRLLRRIKENKRWLYVG